MRYIVTYMDDNSLVKYGVEAKSEIEAKALTLVYMADNKHFVSPIGLVTARESKLQSHFEINTNGAEHTSRGQSVT